MSAPSRRVTGPRYPLNRQVLKLAAIGKKRAVREVATRMGWGEPRAESYIRAVLQRLAAANYSHTVEMDWDPKTTADVYGYRDAKGDWYVKLYMEHGRFVVVSFHEPEYDLTCADGCTMKGRSQ